MLNINNTIKFNLYSIMEKYDENNPVQQEDDSISKMKVETAISKLSEIKISLRQMKDYQEFAKNWMFLKDINLIKVLDAVVYGAKIDNKYCDFKMIISSIEYGFEQLKCSYTECSEMATMCYKRNNDTSAELYWK